jgi:hypothetical protein
MVRKRSLLISGTLLCLAGSACAQSWSGIIAPARATDWSTAGIPGGIPSSTWSQCGSTITPYGPSGHASGDYTEGLVTTTAGSGVITYASGSTFQSYWTTPGINKVTIYDGGLKTFTITSVSGTSMTVTPALNTTFTGATGTNFWGAGGIDPTPINSALAACGSNQYVLLGAGTFNFRTGPLTLKSNEVLRGSGANQTFLNFPQWSYNSCQGWGGNICLSGSNTYPGGGYTQGDWTAGYGQGKTSITLSKVTGIVPNLTPIILDGCDTGYAGTVGSPTCTGSASDNGNLYICQTITVCSAEYPANTARANRGQQEIVVATNITGSGPYTVTISPGLRNPNWAAVSTPQAWWGSATITNAGVENLAISTQYGPTVANIVISVANKCWVSGVASAYANDDHFWNILTVHNEMRNNYLYWTANSQTQSYGIGGISNGDLLIINNIIQGVVDPVNYDAPCPGCVAAYNFAVNQYDVGGGANYLFPAVAMHSTGQSMILSEGNIGSFVDSDDVHGTHDLNTQFRNYWNGYELNSANGQGTGAMPINNTSAVHLAAYSRYMNVIGNVLGTAGFHTNYQCIAITSSYSCPKGQFGVSIYNLGFSGNTQGVYISGSAPNDVGYVVNTLMRWGNYDVVTGSTRWCGNSSDTGWSTTCGSASEIPTADLFYPNPMPTVGDTGAGQSPLPASFFLSAKPSWWPSGKIWPVIGPDVMGGNVGRCTGGTYQWSLALSSGQCGGGTYSPSVVGGHAYSNPAMDCYLNTMGGPPDGSGSELTFNASACYPPSASGTVPSTPAGLTVTVQ